jgi:hypothetical protein
LTSSSRPRTGSTHSGGGCGSWRMNRSHRNGPGGLRPWAEKSQHRLGPCCRSMHRLA